MARMGSTTASRRVRRQLSEEFRVGAVRLVLDEGKTIGAVARELDLTASSLANWVRQARADRTQGKTGLTTDINIYGPLLKWLGVARFCGAAGSIAGSIFESHTIALIDLRNVDVAPTDNTMQSIAATLKFVGEPKHRAYVVREQRRAEFIAQLGALAPAGLHLKPFFSEQEARRC